MARATNSIYYVHLFVVSRFETVGIAASSAADAAQKAGAWYRTNRDDLDAGELILADEVSHYLVRQDGAGDENFEPFESLDNPLIAILVDLVNWRDQKPNTKTLEQIVDDARERVRLVV